MDGLLRRLDALDAHAMSKVHVYPVSEAFLHYTFGGGADCFCEPFIMDLGLDVEGRPARVFTHRRLLGSSSVMVEAKAHEKSKIQGGSYGG